MRRHNHPPLHLLFLSSLPEPARPRRADVVLADQSKRRLQNCIPTPPLPLPPSFSILSFANTSLLQRARGTAGRRFRSSPLSLHPRRPKRARGRGGGGKMKSQGGLPEQSNITALFRNECQRVKEWPDYDLEDHVHGHQRYINSLSVHLR